MLKQADKDKLKKLGIDVDALIAAHNDAAEKDIVIPDGEILTTDQLKTRDENSEKKGANEGKKEGEKEGLKIVLAEIKKVGITIDEAKVQRYGDLATALKGEIDKTGDQKTQALNKQVTDLLADKQQLTTELTTVKETADKTVFNYQQFQHLPENRAKNFNEDEYISMLGKRGVEVKADGVYRNGEIMTADATRSPLPHKDAYKQLFEEFKWNAQPESGNQGGRGGGNSGGAPVGGKSTTQSQALDKWKAANPGKNEVSPEASAFVRAEAKDNPQFDWHN